MDFRGINFYANTYLHQVWYQASLTKLVNFTSHWNHQKNKFSDDFKGAEVILLKFDSY